MCIIFWALVLGSKEKNRSWGAAHEAEKSSSGIHQDVGSMYIELRMCLLFILFLHFSASSSPLSVFLIVFMLFGAFYLISGVQGTHIIHEMEVEICPYVMWCFDFNPRLFMCSRGGLVNSLTFYWVLGQLVFCRFRRVAF